ncbi:unnamed protein product [Phytophthora fragariaefolia]|uniref:Unnamed protein product n=1 Tax=Phytophthora fragariaefolia TaxID=1490495 RepID=A0A9W6XQ83_9STRA|nr:unnamed protein product [Phytophthora fragariaefolia]
MSIAAVENDFSLKSLQGHSTKSFPTSTEAYMHQQEVRTLSAGEYVVTISATRPGDTESHPDSRGGEPNSILTPASIDANLQLAFDCLDREGRHTLSESDIISFLHLYERVMPSRHGKEALRSFMLQHGSWTCPESMERKLTLDDFRDVYFGLAMRDPDTTSDSVRTRLQELVWEDLLCLTSSSGSDVLDNNSRTEIDCRDVVEIVCCFHSDTPLLGAVALPERN